ncbi:hypothetical protein AVEN_187938-1 [Araneus ventricosus]|uniref:Uncharacterized protein n=1 Tax=Araneus ventricosus TaxID=182803 RepID=A0A4Y2DZW0_ARAVE|nr:hypothetical protein AVEN_187938-1 [Araneus ventricosus]
MIHSLFHNMLKGVKTLENILIRLLMKEMSVQKDAQKVEEEHLKQKTTGCIKDVITKKLKFHSFQKTKFLTIMTSDEPSKENIIQFPAYDEIYDDPPSED